MIRVFKHWFSLPSVVQIVIDLTLALFGAVGACVLGFKSMSEMLTGSMYVAVAVIIVLGLNASSGFYDRVCSRTLAQVGARAIFSMFLAAALVFVILWSRYHIGYRDELVAIPALAFFAGVIAYRRVGALDQHAPLLGHRVLGHRVLVLGTGSRALSIPAAAEKSKAMVEVVGFYPSASEQAHAVPKDQILSTTKGLIRTALDLRINEIVVAVGDRRGGAIPLQDLLECKVMGIRVNDLSSHFEKMHGQIRLDSLRAGWLIFGEGFEQGILRRVCKRAFDVLFAGMLLLLSFPLMVLAVIAIVFESGFPIFYVQERTGRDGRSFRVIKFRSMRTDAEKDGKPKWAVGNDDRVTKVGRFIRKFRIDELPQLFNVLGGEMSLVGPRPERPYFVEQLTKELPFYALRHSVKPGVTGWAQVSYGYGASVEDACEKLQYDLFYVKNNTLFLDFLVLFKTIGVVLNGNGAL
jgi:sugar transferase (PEP-CTERM system associated)